MLKEINHVLVCIPKLCFTSILFSKEFFHTDLDQDLLVERNQNIKNH